MKGTRGTHVAVRLTRAEDFSAIESISRQVYPWAPPWTAKQLESHLAVFPEGQLVAVELRTGQVVGMAASLIIRWDDYAFDDSYHDFTDRCMFTNHDPERGRTLYGAEVMVAPGKHGRGVGKQLYVARRQLVRRLGLQRIRAGARLRGYRRVADRMSAADYAVEVVQGRMRDPTLSFQLRQGFHVLAVVGGYDEHDPESLGHAAIIEWINTAVQKRPEPKVLDPRFSAPIRFPRRPHRRSR